MAVEFAQCPHCGHACLAKSLAWHIMARCKVARMVRDMETNKQLEIFDLEARPFAEVLLSVPDGRGGPMKAGAGLPRPEK